MKKGEIVLSKIEEISKIDKKIILIYPVPEAGVDVPNFIIQAENAYDKEFLYEISYKDYINRNRYLIEQFDKAEFNNNIVEFILVKYIVIKK